MFAVVSFIAAFPPVITALVAPVLQPLDADQVPFNGWLSSAGDPDNYRSTAGDIVAAVLEVSINGGAFSASLLGADIAEDDTVAGRVVVTDTVGNVRIFGAGTVTVSAGEEVEISVSIGTGLITSGATVTATVLGLSGGETVAYQWEADGDPVSGATSQSFTPIVGTNCAKDDDITCVVTVDSEDPVTSNARQVIPLQAGAATASRSWVEGEAITPFDFAAQFVLNGNSGSFSNTTLPAGITVSGTTFVGTPTAPGSGTITTTFTDEYSRQTAQVLTYEVTEAVELSMTQTVDGTALLDGSGPVGLTVTNPPRLAGLYEFVFPGGTDDPLVLKDGTITGNPFVGSTLSEASVPFALVDEAGATAGRQWRANGTSISGQTGATYVIAEAVGVAVDLSQPVTDANGTTPSNTNDITVAANLAAFVDVTYDSAGLVIEYTGNVVGITYDSAGFIVEIE
jgi:hypothetical protein